MLNKSTTLILSSSVSQCCQQWVNKTVENHILGQKECKFCCRYIWIMSEIGCLSRCWEVYFFIVVHVVPFSVLVSLAR